MYGSVEERGEIEMVVCYDHAFSSLGFAKEAKYFNTTRGEMSAGKLARVH